MDTTSAFNDQLARARLAALQALVELLQELADPDATCTPAHRERRLLATSILRIKPLDAEAELSPTQPPSSVPLRDPRGSTLSATVEEPHEEIEEILRVGHAVGAVIGAVPEERAEEVLRVSACRRGSIPRRRAPSRPAVRAPFLRMSPAREGTTDG